MPVHIEEMQTSVQVVDPTTLLTPRVLAAVVDAVLRQLKEREAQDRTRSSERAVRSVVEQQRARAGG